MNKFSKLVTPGTSWNTFASLVTLVFILVAGDRLSGQTPPPPLPPGVEDALKLSRNGISEDIILAQIKKSGATYELSADQIVYLHSQGVSQNIIQALVQSRPAGAAAAIPGPSPQIPGAPPQPSSPAPPSGVPMAAPGTPPPGSPEVNFDYFRAQLAPFGTWMELPGYGWCWRPDRALAANPDWRPYYDMGRWVYTENGWFWQSDYGWGDIPFHYGRWIRDPGLGWLWVPDYTWGPAWVFWRHAEADGCIGWAPLPYGAVFVEGGWEYRGRRYGVEYDFGLDEHFYVFVGYDHFHDGFFRLRGREWAYHVRGERIHAFYGRSVCRNEFRRDEHGRFVNEGLGRERIEHLTNRRVEVTRFDERRPVGDRSQLANQQRSGSERGQTQGQSGRAAPASQVYRPPATAPARQPQSQQSNKKR